MYANVLNNLSGPDRDEAMEVLDNDAKFDRWMQKFHDRMRREMAPSGGRGVSQEEYLTKYAKVYGGDNHGGDEVGSGQ